MVVLTTPRLYSNSQLAEGKLINLRAEDGHYLARVMRLGVGAKLRLFNGKDGEWLAELKQLSAGNQSPAKGKGKASKSTKPHQAGPIRDAYGCQLITPLRPQSSEGLVALTLWVSPLRKARLEWLVEKISELGASQLNLVQCRYSQPHPLDENRLKSIAKEAAEQSERLSLLNMAISPPYSFAAMLDSIEASHGLLFYAAELGAAQTLPKLRAEYEAQRNRGISPSSVHLLVGPEGGLAPDEFSLLQHKNFAVATNLGPRILRSETAVITALAQWLGAGEENQQRPWYRADL